MWRVEEATTLAEIEAAHGIIKSVMEPDIAAGEMPVCGAGVPAYPALTQLKAAFTNGRRLFVFWDQNTPKGAGLVVDDGRCFGWWVPATDFDESCAQAMPMVEQVLGRPVWGKLSQATQSVLDVSMARWRAAADPDALNEHGEYRQHSDDRRR